LGQLEPAFFASSETSETVQNRLRIAGALMDEQSGGSLESPSSPSTSGVGK
jgi:hypothetical protein